ncbi:unnamed protein product, partial [Discosporangium mesarthrocarpum]
AAAAPRGTGAGTGAGEGSQGDKTGPGAGTGPNRSKVAIATPGSWMNGKLGLPMDDKSDNEEDGGASGRRTGSKGHTSKQGQGNKSRAQASKAAIPGGWLAALAASGKLGAPEEEEEDENDEHAPRGVNGEKMVTATTQTETEEERAKEEADAVSRPKLPPWAKPWTPPTPTPPPEPNEPTPGTTKPETEGTPEERAGTNPDWVTALTSGNSSEYKKEAQSNRSGGGLDWLQAAAVENGDAPEVGRSQGGIDWLQQAAAGQTDKPPDEGGGNWLAAAATGRK